MLIMDMVRTFKIRILLSTDLNARGLDLPSVNLVVNLDTPPSDATYMHRVGRAGRFGSLGVAVSVVTTAELSRLRGVVERTQSGELQPLEPQLAEQPQLADVKASQSRKPRSKSRVTRALTHADAAIIPAEVLQDLPVGAKSWPELQAIYSYWYWRAAMHRALPTATPWYSSSRSLPWMPFPQLCYS
jgi:superfamily II DNA/RNA helicase